MEIHRSARKHGISDDTICHSSTTLEITHETNHP